MEFELLRSVAALAVEAGGAAILPPLSAAQTSPDKTNVWTCRDVSADYEPLAMARIKRWGH